MLKDALLIARLDLGIMLRQKETLLWAFLMPVIFFYFIGTVTKGFGDGPDQEELAVRVAPDAGFLADEVLRRLEEQDFKLVHPDGDPESETTFEESERRLSLPAGFTAGVLAGEQQEVLFKRASEGLSAQYDDFRLRRAVYTVLADVIAAAAPKASGTPHLADLSAADLEALRARPRSLALEVSQAGRRKTIPTGFEQAVPGTMVMFTMIVLLTTGASSLLVERRAGLLRRLASAPMRRGAVVLGKWGARVGLAAVQVAFAMAVGRCLFGVRWGDGLPMLGCVLLAYAGLLAALSLLVGTFARTEGQAIGLSVLATNVFAALGGCWWPIEVTPRFMQKLALFLPTGWTMDAMHKLVSFGAPASAALPHVLGMGLCALALGALAARFFRFQ